MTTPDVEISFTLCALEEEYISPEAIKPMHAALATWSEAEEGEPVIIERQVSYKPHDIIISPDVSIYTRRRDRPYQEVFQDFPLDQRRRLADAICMSGFGAASHFTHDKIDRAAGGTIPKAGDFRMLYLRDALIFMPDMPITYWEDHVSLFPQIPLREKGMAGLGTILVMPTDGGGHARMRRWQAVRDAYDLYMARWPEGRRNKDLVLVPNPPVEILTDP